MQRRKIRCASAMRCTAALLGLSVLVADVVAGGVPVTSLRDAAAKPERFRLRGAARRALTAHRKLAYQAISLDTCTSDSTGVVTTKQRWEWQNLGVNLQTDERDDSKFCAGDCASGISASETCLATETCSSVDGASIGAHGCLEAVDTCAPMMRWEIIAWDPACKCTRIGLQRGIFKPVFLKNVGSDMCMTGSLTQTKCDINDPAQRFYYNTDRSIRFRVDGTYKCLTMP